MSHPAALLPFVLLSFAANSLAIRHVIGARLIEPGMFSAMRFVAGAVTLATIALVRREKVVVRRANLGPALWLGAYALGISYGYRYIGAGPGTLIFYAAVLLTLVGHDRLTGVAVPVRRSCGALVSLGGIATLTWGSFGQVNAVGIVLLGAAGTAWGLYTAAGRCVINARSATTGNFVIVACTGAPATAAGTAAGLRITADGVVWAVMVGALTTGIAYVAWFRCQQSMSGTSAASVQLIVPLITAGGAVVLLGEQPSTTLLIAAIFVAVGMWLARPGADHTRNHR